MKNPIRNETSLVLLVAAIFSAVAIPVLSGFLEPSQPPAVAAVQIGDPRDGGKGRGNDSPAGRPAAKRDPAPARESGPEQPAPAPTHEQPVQPVAPPVDDAAPPVDDAVEGDDDGGED